MNKLVKMVIASAVAGLGLTACSSSTQPPANPTTSTTALVQAPKAEQNSAASSVTSDYGVQLIDGKEGTEYGKTYACKESFESLQVPVGQTAQQDGTTVTLSQTSGSSYDTVQTLEIKVAGPASVPAIIVNPVAHGKAPQLYPETVLKINLKIGGSGKYQLIADAFADNYVSDGIADVTLCLAH